MAENFGVQGNRARLSPVMLRQLDLSHVVFFLGAVERQAVRVLDPDAHYEAVQADCYIFANVLRQLHRAAKLCEPHAPAAVSDAIEFFESDVHAFKDLRDIVEHFDDYHRGNGRLQREGRMPGDFLEWFEHDGSTVLMIIPPWHLNVATATEAAQVLAERVTQALT